MKATVFLVMTRSGVARMNIKRPALALNERCVRLVINVPDAVFQEPPMLDAQLDVPAEAMIRPDPPAPVNVEIWGEP